MAILTNDYIGEKTINKQSTSHESGVTLIELMIVISIIGILSSIAYPGYTNYVRDTHRTLAKGVLLEVLSKQQDYYARNMSYTTDLSKLGYTLSSGKLKTEDSRYDITAANCSAPLSDKITVCVQLTATAIGAQASDGNLSANSAGGKSPAEKW